MSEFFFISSFDRISSEMLLNIINVHPDISCNIIQTDSLIPQALPSTIDQFIKENKTDKKFTGNIYNFGAYELQYKIISEKTQQSFRRANIVLSPMLRMRFLMHSWYRVGVAPEEIFNHLHTKIMTSNIKNNVLKLYIMIDFYKHIRQMVTESLANLQQQYNANPNAHNPKLLTDLMSAHAQLIFVALAVTLAFDYADIPSLSKSFQFEKLLSNEAEFLKFINYITNGELPISEEYKNQLKIKLQQTHQSLSEMKFHSWEHWQTELLNTYLITKIPSVYGPSVDKSLLQHYESVGYSFSPAEQKSYTKLVSIQLNSNRPAQLSAFFDNIEETVDNPQDIEVIVNIDSDDNAMQSLLNKEALNRKFTLKYIQTPRPKSFYDLWEPLNKILKVTDPHAYFLLNISDEQFFVTKGWDTILKKYVGFFPDHIFRLRASRNKFRNYFDRWECNFAQDSIPFTTKKWLDIVGDWNPCFGPDSFQQLTSFYLAKEGVFTHDQFLRDIPIVEIEFSGDIPAVGVSRDKAWKLGSDSIKAMQICQSYKMQLEARRRAMLLKAHIFMHANKIQAEIIDSSKKKVIQVRMNNRSLLEIEYKLNWFLITLVNQWRKLFFFHYFGRGMHEKINPIKSYFHYLVSKHKFIYKIFTKLMSKA